MTLSNIQMYLLVTLLYYGLLTSVNSLDDDYEEVDSRIVGGRKCRKGEAFYQLALLKNGGFTCGATLVLSPTSSVQIALTAGHCVFNFNANTRLPSRIFSLRGGTLNKYAGGQTRNVSKVVLHPYFSPNTMSNDIAILFLDRPFHLKPTFRPVALPLNELDGYAAFLKVSGWGKIHEIDEEFPKKLQTITVPVVRNRVCAEWYANFRPILPTSICGGFELGGHDACQGDSGGPAVGEDSRGLFLAGIVSWGIGCAGFHAPGVYTRVSKFVDWISEQTFYL